MNIMLTNVYICLQFSHDIIGSGHKFHQDLISYNLQYYFIDTDYFSAKQRIRFKFLIWPNHPKRIFFYNYYFLLLILFFYIY